LARRQRALEALPDGATLVFTSPTGTPLRHSNFRHRVWLPALQLLGLLGLHFQDLRQTGRQYASDAGASLREMMARMGHDSARAAMTYQDSTTEHQRATADQVGRNAGTALGKLSVLAREWHAVVWDVAVLPCSTVNRISISVAAVRISSNRTNVVGWSSMDCSTRQ